MNREYIRGYWSLSKVTTGLFLLVASSTLTFGQKVPEGPKWFKYVYSEKLSDEYDEYNFWNGNWDVVWKNWTGKDVYTPVGYSQHKVFSMLNGKALIEWAYSDSVAQGSKTAGFSIRYFDDNLKKWVMLQSWPGKNSTNISSLQGTHHHGRIQLYQYGKTTREIDGNPIGTAYTNRYTFSDALPDSYRWESSFSVDSTMRRWHTRSIAEGTRKPDFRALIDENEKWFTYGDGFNCDDNILAPLQPFFGEWEGEITYNQGGDQKSYKANRVLKPFLSNCAAFGYQVNFIEEKPNTEIIFVTYLTGSQEWVFYTLNDVYGESHKTFFTKSLDGKASFSKRDVFDVISQGDLKSFSWELNGSEQQIISGAIPKKNWSFKADLRKVKY